VLSLIPISDANPTRRFPVVTVGLIIANIIAFFWQSTSARGAGLDRFFFEQAPVPCQLADRCPDGVQLTAQMVVEIPQRGLVSFLVAIVVSTFLHAGLLHIAGNMLFLWVFGNNIEDHLGRVKFLVFYLLGGIAAAMAHVLWTLKDLPCTNDSFGACVPAVGASGAVAAVMGAYLLLFPRARVNVLVPIVIIFTVIQMSAFAVLGLWFLYQFLIAAQETVGATGVAWMAHVGGFVFGLVAIYLLGGRPQPPPGLPSYRPAGYY
jgi:membrane associated rhomboid family serine protease